VRARGRATRAGGTGTGVLQRRQDSKRRGGRKLERERGRAGQRRDISYLGAKPWRQRGWRQVCHVSATMPGLGANDPGAMPLYLGADDCGAKNRVNFLKSFR
jgi:hypothetical protein